METLLEEMSQTLKVPFPNEWDKSKLILEDATHPGIVNALHQLGFDMTNLGIPRQTEVWQHDQTSELLILHGSGEQFDPFVLTEPDTLNPKFYQDEYGFSRWIDKVCSHFEINRRKFNFEHIKWLQNWFENSTDEEELKRYVQDISK